MKTKIIYKLDNGTETETVVFETTNLPFIPNRNDTWIRDGWGYVIGYREFTYSDDCVEVTIYGYREGRSGEIDRSVSKEATMH